MRRGKWEPLDTLGQGGQGTVYRAINTQALDLRGKVLPEFHYAMNALRQIGTPERYLADSERVLQLIEQCLSRHDPKLSGALKVLHDDVRTEGKARTRLEREVSALRALDHPHIVKLLDVDVEGGWFVTQYFPAGSLEKYPDLFTIAKVLWALVSGRHKLPLWNFRGDEFNLEVQFPDAPEMIAVNALLSRCLVERETDCLPSAFELLVEVDALVARLRGRRGSTGHRMRPRLAARGESRGGPVFDVPTPQKSPIFESFFRPKLPRMTFTTGC